MCYLDSVNIKILMRILWNFLGSCLWIFRKFEIDILKIFIDNFKFLLISIYFCEIIIFHWHWQLAAVSMINFFWYNANKFHLQSGFMFTFVLHQISSDLFFYSTYKFLMKITTKLKTRLKYHSFELSEKSQLQVSISQTICSYIRKIVCLCH